MIKGKCFGCGFDYDIGLLGLKACPKCGDYADFKSHKERREKKKQEHNAKIRNSFRKAMEISKYDNFHFVYLYKDSDNYFELYLDEITNIIYIGFYIVSDMTLPNASSLSPWYSANGKIQKFIDGKIVEID